MTSVASVNCLSSKEVRAEVLRRLPLFDGRLPAPTGTVEQAMSITLKEAMADIQSTDLEAMATVLRNVVGLIDVLLLERQLAEYGFDAVHAASFKIGSADIAVKHS